ncbi:MAG: hypothetical protein R3B70_10840 [Polyangiaceae bacterium]
MNAAALPRWIAERAREADGSKSSTLILAAEIYAAAEALFASGSLDTGAEGARFADRPPHYFRSPADVRRALADERRLAAYQPVELYSKLICALAALDDVCNDAGLFPTKGLYDQGFSAPRSVPLKQPLSGTVRVWRRPPAAWRRVSVEAWKNGPSSSLHGLDMSWERPRQDGVLACHPVKQTDFRPYDLLAPDGFSVALCPMMGAYCPEFTAVPGQPGFTVGPRIKPHDWLLAQIDTTIRAAIGNSVKCLVFPELSVDLLARAETLERLSGWGPESTLRTVVAGSYHDHSGSGPPYPHEAVTLPGVGRVGGHRKALFLQRKPGSLTLPAGAVLGAPEGLELLHEMNEPASDVRVLDTEAGRFAVLIASEATCPRMPVFARAARPDFLLVLAFSRAPSAFLQVADELAMLGISTLFVQAHGAAHLASPDEGDDPVLAFARLAIRADRTRHLPTRWRWRWKAGVEVSGAPGSPWGPVPPLLRHVGHVLTRGDSPESPLGMVLNIGAVFRELS